MSQHTVLWGICGLHSAEYQCDSHQIIKKLKWWPDERPTQSSDIQNTDDSTRYSYHTRVGRRDTRRTTVSSCWDSESGCYENKENNEILTSNTGSYWATQFGIFVCVLSGGIVQFEVPAAGCVLCNCVQIFSWIQVTGYRWYRAKSHFLGDIAGAKDQFPRSLNFIAATSPLSTISFP